LPKNKNFILLSFFVPKNFATKKDQRKGWSVPFNELMTSMVRLQCLLN
jgi:hypothetical protein